MLVADAVEIPGNLGTLIRSLDACAADCLVLTNRRTRLTHPKVLKGSQGMCLTVPSVEFDDVADAIEWLRGNGFAVYVADTDDARPYRAVDYRGRVAFVVGSERYGVSKDWYEPDFGRVAVPMLGRADSLNVSVSASILLYEARAQQSRLVAAARQSRAGLTATPLMMTSPVAGSSGGAAPVTPLIVTVPVCLLSSSIQPPRTEASATLLAMRYSPFGACTIGIRNVNFCPATVTEPAANAAVVRAGEARAVRTGQGELTVARRALQPALQLLAVAQVGDAPGRRGPRSRWRRRRRRPGRRR